MTDVQYQTPSDPFAGIQFDPASHTYAVDGIPLRSVSGVISAYKPVFDAPTRAVRSAAKEGISVEAKLAEWDIKRDRSIAKGHRVHRYIESILRPTPKEEAESDPFLALNTALPKLPEMEAFDRFLLHATETLKLTFVEVEWVIGDKELGIAGTVDAVAFSSVTGKWHILDWKTNKEYRTESRWGNLLPPFRHLSDCEHSTYSLQTSLYRLLIERNFPPAWGDPANVMGFPYIVHLDANGDYTVYRPHDLRVTLGRILTAEPEGAA